MDRYLLVDHSEPAMCLNLAADATQRYQRALRCEALGDRPGLMPIISVSHEWGMRRGSFCVM